MHPAALRKLVFAVLTGLACAAALPAAAQPAPGAGPAGDQTVIDAAMGRVRSLLRNPTSAEFRSLVAYPSGIVCGEVNSMNGKGAFESTRFAVRARRVSVFPWPAPGEFDLSQFTLEAICR